MQVKGFRIVLRKPARVAQREDGERAKALPGKDKWGINLSGYSLTHYCRRSMPSGACALHGAQQLKESATGLFGDSATDLIAGSEWASFKEALDLYMTVVNPHIRNAVGAWFPSANAEWFDVHARRTAAETGPVSLHTHREHSWRLRVIDVKKMHKGRMTTHLNTAATLSTQQPNCWNLKY